MQSEEGASSWVLFKEPLDVVKTLYLAEVSLLESILIDLCSVYLSPTSQRSNGTRGDTSLFYNHIVLTWVTTISLVLQSSHSKHIITSRLSFQTVMITVGQR